MLPSLRQLLPAAPLHLQQQLSSMIESRSRETMKFAISQPQLKALVLAWLAHPAPTPDYPPLADNLARLMESGNSDAVEGLIKAVDLQPNQAALEIGFGTGAALEALLSSQPEAGPVYGVDTSPFMLDFARRRLAAAIGQHKLQLFQASVSDLPLAENSVDVIFHLNCIYFWQPLQTALAECRRLLRPNGRMITGFKPETLADVFRLGENASASHDGPGSSNTTTTPFRHADEALVQQAIMAAGFEATQIIAADHFSVAGRRYHLLCHRVIKS